MIIISITMLSCGDNEKTVKHRHDSISTEVWIVEWNTRDGEYSSDLNKQYDLYFNEEDAEKRKEELIYGFEFVKNTSDETNIRIYKQKQ